MIGAVLRLLVAGLLLAPVPGLAQSNGTQYADGPRLNAMSYCSFPKPQPDLSRSDEEQGVVVVGLLVGLDGQVRESKIIASSGNKVNDQIVAGAFAGCKFLTTTADGTPLKAPTWTQMTYRWPLNGNSNISSTRPEYQTYLTRFWGNSSLREEVERRVKSSPLATSGLCSAFTYQIPDQPEMLVPLKFNMVGHVTGGVLKYAVPVQGCAEAQSANIFIYVRKEQSIDPVTGVPGGTLVPADQQKEVAATAIVESSLAGPRDPNCDSQIILDTQVSGETPNAGTSWRERWTVARCKARYQVPLLLTPAEGGKVAVSLAPGESIAITAPEKK